MVKVVSGDMRIGLREGHLEAAIAAAFDRPLAEVQWAGMLTGDLGHTAELARDDRLGEAELALFRPLKSMLASPVANEDEVLTRLGTPVWTEDKYDGIRAQLHKKDREVRLYSRDLHDVSDGYPEVVASAAKSTGTASWTASCSHFATAWRCRSSSCRRVWAARTRRRRCSARSP